MGADQNSHFLLSEEAEKDLLKIVIYTIHEFGEQQSLKYKQGLKNTCQKLADNPNIGTNTSIIKKGLRRFPYMSHVVFYISDDNGVLIIRILHKSMDFERHLI